MSHLNLLMSLSHLHLTQNYKCIDDNCVRLCVGFIDVPAKSDKFNFKFKFDIVPYVAAAVADCR
jgi:hypothetical protein